MRLVRWGWLVPQGFKRKTLTSEGLKAWGENTKDLEDDSSVALRISTFQGVTVAGLS